MIFSSFFRALMLLSSDLTLTHLSVLLAGSLLTALWEGAVLVSGTALALRLSPRMTAAARSFVWTAVFVLAVTLPFTAAWHGGSRNADLAGSALPGVLHPGLHLGSQWALALVAAWAMLSLYRGVQLLRSVFHLRRIARLATPISPHDAVTNDVELPLHLPLDRRVQLCASSDVQVPSVVGFFRPRILVPSSLLEDMSAEDLRQVVLHEREHLRRCDDWTNLMQKLALVVFPVNPVLFWVERRLCAERELACDDGVLRATGAGKAYATCLTNLAERTSLGARMRQSLTLALGAWQRRSELAQRVERILSSSQRERRPGLTALSAAMVLAVVGGGATVLARLPQMISFDSQGTVARAEVPMRAPQLILAGMTHSAGLGNSGRPGEQLPHATLVNAVMPERRISDQKPPRMPLHVSSRRFVRAAVARRRVTPIATIVSFADWSESRGQALQARELSRPRLTLAVSQDSQFTYAAVPVRGGWLIVQL